MKENKKLKVFVSIPMKGRPDQLVKSEIQYIFDNYKEDSGSQNLELVETFIKENPPVGIQKYFWYRIKSLQLLLESDIVIMASDWEGYAGCVLELQTALGCGKAVVFNKSMDNSGILDCLYHFNSITKNTIPVENEQQINVRLDCYIALLLRTNSIYNEITIEGNTISNDLLFDYTTDWLNILKYMHDEIEGKQTIKLNLIWYSTSLCMLNNVIDELRKRLKK